ncbi:dTDP-4-dehydrorhamnose reductase [Hoyosella subflava]|uniref:dTDP-4-dehydrorhamnose reductase n=1 Tax=Hoyosella subflava (strain DSM 45089 / JCM 17490 / NBRC 109087 / DQS3-9A1) TaxID=443218 RepID=F6EFY9_HOYSD|nr:dTDP-4-dehydrorhamnose reductase [Hoyosella subflava]AEF42253.1 dTDP-4-dehydrorhamnose reductase [Hoyosella subflava DQS3-9A1]
MRILVTGARGQVGQQIVRRGAATGLEVVGMSSTELDITVESSVHSALTEVRPNVVINCAAYTAVDKAELDFQRAADVNGRGARNIATACHTTEAHLIHVSTDYVFGGDASEPYEIDAPKNPKTVYGRTKLDGEGAVRAVAPSAQIVRTAWVFTGTGSDFVATMHRLESERQFIDVVDDQVGSPTYAADLADGLLRLASTAQSRTVTTLHAANSGTATWYQLARAVFEEIGADPDRIRPCTTEEFPRPAPRPRYSVLSDRAWRAAGLEPLRPWRDALHAALADHSPQA